MQWTPDTLKDLLSPPFSHVIDVRSPSEFALDHLPGAMNLPVLDDAERAEIGTIYVQDSRFRARKLGAAKVARNAAAHLEGALSGFDGSFNPLVYCWRGGQRSGSFASILAQIGWRVGVLDGGYRTYRRMVAEVVQNSPVPSPVLVLDGNTGTAKTDILGAMSAQGAQVIDLEGLANHRGSVFGQRPGGQPSQKAFEGALAQALSTLDPKRPVWVEAESSRIGALNLPAPIWAALRTARRVTIAAPLEARVAYLHGAYGDWLGDHARVTQTLRSLGPLQGNDRVEGWINAITAGNSLAVIEGLLVHHYDPRYAKSRAKRAPSQSLPLPLEDLTPDTQSRAAQQVLQMEAELLRLSHTSSDEGRDQAAP